MPLEKGKERLGYRRTASMRRHPHTNSMILPLRKKNNRSKRLLGLILNCDAPQNLCLSLIITFVAYVDCVSETSPGWMPRGMRLVTVTLLCPSPKKCLFDLLFWIHPSTANVHLRPCIKLPSSPLGSCRYASSFRATWTFCRKLLLLRCSSPPVLDFSLPSDPFSSVGFPSGYTFKSN